MRAQLQAADAQMVEESEQPCCDAKSDKYWVTDPTGIAWEDLPYARLTPSDLRVRIQAPHPPMTIRASGLRNLPQHVGSAMPALSRRSSSM